MINFFPTLLLVAKRGMRWDSAPALLNARHGLHPPMMLRWLALALLLASSHAGMYGGAPVYISYSTQDNEHLKAYMKYDILLSSCFPYPVPDVNDFLGAHPEAAYTCSYYLNDIYADDETPESYYPENSAQWTPVYAKAEGIRMPSLFPSPASWASQYASGVLTAAPVCASDAGTSRALYLCRMRQTLSAFTIKELNGDHLDTTMVYGSPWCKMCIPVEPHYTCPAGTTITYPLATLDGAVRNTFDPAGVAINQYHFLGCSVQCEPGTWLTCTTPDYNCRYHVPRDFDMTTPADGGFNTWVRNVLIQYRDSINALPDYPPPLAGKCFPCNESIGRQHYGKVLDIVPVRDQSNRIAQLNHRCPGGPSAPLKCGTNQGAIVDSRGYATQCVCADAYFQNSSHNGACDPCPAGYYCTAQLNDQYGADSQRACPDGSYSFAGSSACTPCTTQDCPDPSQSRVRCMQLSSGTKSGGLFNFQVSDAVCADCSNCVELGYKKDDGVPCLNVATLDSTGVAAGLTRAPTAGS